MASALIAASCGAPSTPKMAIQHSEFRANLKNGLRMVIIPDKTTPMVQVDVRYEVGSNEDPPGKKGLAHLVEHMMFQHRFGDEATPVEKRQPTFEILPQITTGMNAYTIWDKTHYWLQAPKEDVKVLLNLEAARMSMGCKTIQPEQFEREREVVRNEIRMRLDNPQGQMFYDIGKAIYPEGHPYRELTAGNDQQLANITFQDVCDFMDKYYQPARAVVLVAGNVDPDDMGKQIQFFFGAIEGKKPAPRVAVEPVAIKKQKIVKEYAIDRTIVSVAWAMPPHMTEEYDNAAFMQFILGGMAGGLASTYDICDPAGVQELGGMLAPVMVAMFELRPGKSVDDCLDFVWKSAARAHQFFESSDYDQQKNQVARAKQDFIEGMEPISARTEWIADRVQFDKRLEFGGDATFMFEELEHYEKLDAGKYKSFVQKTLSKDKALVFVAKATTEGKTGDERAALKFETKTHEEKSDPIIDPSEAKRPLPAPKSDSILVTAERYTLGNGMNVVLLPYEGLPIVQGNLVFATGAIHEDADKAGLADVAAGIDLPIDAEVFGAAGVRVGGGSGMTHTTFRSRGMSPYLKEVILALDRIIKAGTINQEGIEAFQKRFKDMFKRPDYQRQFVYQRELDSAIFGPEHDFVTKGTPTPKTLGRIGRDAAMDFAKKHYSAKNATLVIAGNFDPAQAKAHIQETLGSWDGGHKDKSVSLDTPQRTGPEYIGVVDREGASQMQITIAYPGPSGIDGQEAARRVLAEMLNMRMGEVRTKLGSSYGIRAGRQPSVGPTYYEISGPVDAARAGESLKFMREQVAALRSGVDFDRDFVVARRVVLKRLLAESTESSTLAGRLAQIAMYGLAPDHYEKLARYVAAVSPAQVQALMQNELDPNKEVIVNLADRPTLVKAFDAAGLTNPRILDPADEK